MFKNEIIQDNNSRKIEIENTPRNRSTISDTVHNYDQLENKHCGRKLHSTLHANQHTPHQQKEGLRHVLARLYTTQYARGLNNVT